MKSKYPEILQIRIERKTSQRIKLISKYLCNNKSIADFVRDTIMPEIERNEQILIQKGIIEDKSIIPGGNNENKETGNEWSIEENKNAGRNPQSKS